MQKDISQTVKIESIIFPLNRLLVKALKEQDARIKALEAQLQQQKD